MLTLRSAPPSPFGRKVKIASSLLGLSDRIRVENADTTDPNERLRTQNPLGKIPTLIGEDGETLYDSRVIVEYLDHLAGGCRLIPEGTDRFRALTLQALADGVMDAGILQIYETRWRTEERREKAWTDYQAEKVSRALAHAEVRHAEPPERFHIGHVALAAALGYLDLRFEGRWRQGHPRLVAFLDDFERRVPAFAETRFTPPA
jgi:glutathione S-transferase